MLISHIELSHELPRGNSLTPQPQAPANSQPAPGGGSSQQAPITDEIFTQLVSGIGNYVSQAAQGQQPSESVGDFLDRLGQNYGVPVGEGR